MPETPSNTNLKKRRSHYRLVIMNDDTFEEVVRFRLTRLSVYMAFSTIFVLMIGLTTALLVLTPLKYYIPGSSGSGDNRRELQSLKIRTDSIENAIKYKDIYLESLRKALGAGNDIKDTASLKIPNQEISDD